MVHFKAANMKTLYDIVISGSGPGGYRAAVLATLRKQKVAIIEKQDWGGCCLNRGCVPKKAWHNTAKILTKNHSLHEIGVSGTLKPDFNKAWQHQKNTVTTVRDSYLSYMKRLGIDFFEGHGKIVKTDEQDHNTVLIDIIGQNERILNTKHIIIATGSSPNRLQPFDISSNLILNTDQLFDGLPPAGNEVAIIGGGVIAVEFAYILQALGKNIHWYSRSSMLSKTDFSDQSMRILKEKLQNISLNTIQSLPETVSEIDGRIQLTFEHRALDKTVDWVLLATGRTPYSSHLGIEDFDIELDEKGFIKTDQYRQTNAQNIYAIGDVRSHNMTANQAIADANVVIENIINGNHKSQDENWVPQSIYSVIEIAKIGLNEDQAEDLDYEPAVGFSAFESSPCAIGQHNTDGHIRIIGDMDSGEFLGGEVVGENAAELIQLMAMNKDTKTALHTFSQFSVNHPSRAEELVNASETLASKWGLSDFIFPNTQEPNSKSKP